MADTVSRRSGGRRRALGLLAAAPTVLGIGSAVRGSVAEGSEGTPATTAPGLLRVYLARHGQTDWNRERRLQGGTDTKLNETGVAQARALAHLLAGLAFDAVYSSALERSRRTAEIVAAGRGVEALPGLNEQRLGAFEGLFLDGRERQREAEYRRRSQDPADSLDGGESALDHWRRVLEAMAALRRWHPSGTVLVVGHGGTNPLVLRALLGLSAAEADAVDQANDEVYLVEVAGGQAGRVYKHVPRERLGEL